MRRILSIVIVICFIPLGALAGDALQMDLSTLTVDQLLELKELVANRLHELGAYPFIQLNRNDKGDEVILAQTKLSELGYLDAKISGKFDNETQKAQKAFEKANGLENDGVASIADQKVLFSEKAIPKEKTAATNTPKPEKTVDPFELEYQVLDYESYARNPEDFLGQKVLLKGRVVQVLGDRETGYQLRLAVLNNTDHIILVTLSDDPGYNILEGDRLTVYARLSNTVTYTATMGQKITIPSCFCDRIELS